MLDGLQAGVAVDAVYAVLREQDSVVEGYGRAVTLRNEAEELVNGGYREMLRIPA